MDVIFPYISRRSQRSQRIDYYLLNDGSDDEAVPEDPIFNGLVSAKLKKG
jgi:hypothetical protein